eukprot:jgi/Tetstr1/453941/TSEL_040860.t1
MFAPLLPPERVWTKLALHFSLLVVMCLVNVILVVTKVAKYNVEEMSVFDTVHYTITTWTTTGFGDIHPTNVAAKIMSWVKMLLFLFVMIAYT